MQFFIIYFGFHTPCVTTNYALPIRLRYRTIVETLIPVSFAVASPKNINIVISYSNKGVMPIEELEKLCSKYYPKVKSKFKDYKHSTQGKGSMGRLEYLLILQK